MSPLLVLRRSLFWVSVPIFFINFALPVQSKALGASALEIGGLFSLFTVALIFLRPLIGILLDRYGRKPFLFFSLMLYTLAYLGYSLASGIEWMYAARLLQGIGAAFLLLSVDTITTDIVPEDERATAMGANFQTQSRATFVGATIGFTLLATIPAYGWMISFGLFAMFAFGTVILVASQLPESQPLERETFQRLPATLLMKRLFIVLVPLGFVNALIQPIYIIYLQDTFTTDVRVLSWAFLPAGIVYAVVPAKAGQWVDRLGALRPLVAALLLVTCIYLLLPSLPGLWTFVIGFTVTALGWAFIEPARKSMTASYANQSQIARGFGMTEMFYGLGATAGPLAGGYVYDQFGSANAFYLAAGVSVFAMILILLLFKTQLLAGNAAEPAA